jgi:hypothetical protein
MAATDMAYAYLTQVQGYETGQLIDIGWIVAYLAIAVGALRAEPGQTPARPLEYSGPTPAAVLVPFVPMLTALTVAGVQMQLGQRLDRVAWSIACALVLLVLARQTLLIIELWAHPKRDARMPVRVVAALGATVHESGHETPPTPEPRR